ncbi:unnamed protein product [Acanthoscelides obtectus]|uniref:Uncharacterized protein n=1 Tax=Acanthoscelides obtectus TaxID=200917 RepID=A0A9P0KMS3_ACAOB|nr:unnamed protein product [Acanthoscelides obtectus]CAK1666738.1 hypothetical protein AOBTE_LOCUS25464 [Acanthoscelides obtectus]
MLCCRKMHQHTITLGFLLSTGLTVSVIAGHGSDKAGVDKGGDDGTSDGTTVVFGVEYDGTYRGRACLVDIDRCMNEAGREKCYWRKSCDSLWVRL